MSCWTEKRVLLAWDFDPWLANLDGPLVHFLPWLTVSLSKDLPVYCPPRSHVRWSKRYCLTQRLYSSDSLLSDRNVGLGIVFRTKQWQTVLGLSFRVFCKPSLKATRRNQHTPTPRILPTKSPHITLGNLLCELQHIAGENWTNIFIPLRKYCHPYNWK